LAASVTELQVRADFSCLDRVIGGRRLVYLDAAASTPSPDRVLDDELRARRNLFANVHRGQHALSEEATSAFEGARRRVARFIGAEPRSIVFTRGTTESINLVSRGLGLPRDAVVLASRAEHHSNLTPWQRECRLVFLPGEPGEPIDPAVLGDALRQHRPRLFAFQHASNVTGVIQAAGALCRVAREHGVTTLVDAAQSAPHLPLNVEQLGCDFLAFSGHKMLGPRGIGVLFGRPSRLAELGALCVGGGAVRDVSSDGYSLRPFPEGLEAGTPNVAGAIGLAAAIDYLEALGMDRVHAHGTTLSRELREVAAALPNVRVLCSSEAESLPVLSLVLGGGAMSANQMAALLSDGFGIMARSGLLCAHPLFEHFDAKAGALRVSAHVYNTVADIRFFGESAAQLLRRFG
jgi:cysteine desulfurase / selenocysteine lyase